MKWIAAIPQRRASLRTGRTMFFLVLAAIVLAMPLGFADMNVAADGSANSEAKISVMELRFKQVGQAFGDFAFGVRSFLTFDESAKVELIRERHVEMQERQEAWLDMKEEAFADGELSLEEKEEIQAMLQAEHEAIIKEHLRLTSEIREIQLKAKASGRADLEDEADAAAEAESGSSLSLGLVSLDVKGDINGKTRTRALFIENTDSAKVHVSGNVALDSETRTAINTLLANLSADQNLKIEVEVEKEAGANATVENEVSGELTADQQALLASLESKAEALVEASARSDARLEIEIRHKATVENDIDTAAEAQAVVEKRLHVDASHVTTETRSGAQVFVVTGTETKTNGDFELIKSFEVVVESGTGLILSADMTEHFEQVGEASVSGSSSVSAGSSTGSSSNIGVSSNSGANGSASAGTSASGSAAGSASVNSGSAGASGSASAATVGGVSIG